MPRHGRVDYPGALHHVIVRGINRAAIFHDDKDRHIFIIGLERGLEKTGLQCHAWVLLSNHLHLLLQTVTESLTQLMCSLLTGYAIYFNRRHKRVGYLFRIDTNLSSASARNIFCNWCATSISTLFAQV